MLIKISFKKESFPRHGWGKLFYTASHPSPKLWLTAMPHAPVLRFQLRMAKHATRPTPDASFEHSHLIKVNIRLKRIIEKSTYRISNMKN
jgi:hypothetical protein